MKTIKTKYLIIFGKEDIWKYGDDINVDELIQKLAQNKTRTTKGNINTHGNTNKASWVDIVTKQLPVTTLAIKQTVFWDWK